MQFKAIAGAVLLGLACAAPGAQALAAGDKTIPHARVHGEASPPIGYVGFCSSHPDECAPKGEVVKRIDLSPERWLQLREVNGFVNGKISPVSDLELYGKPEFWTYPTDAGDCEDYLLLKKRYLEGMGFPASTLLITVVLDEKNEGHAILTVAAKDGDFILDNRRDDILRWSDTNYRYLKRQSAADPRRWVALVKTAPAVAGFASESQRQSD